MCVCVCANVSMCLFLDSFSPQFRGLSSMAQGFCLLLLAILGHSLFPIFGCTNSAILHKCAWVPLSFTFHTHTHRSFPYPPFMAILSFTHLHTPFLNLDFLPPPLRYFCRGEYFSSLVFYHVLYIGLVFIFDFPNLTSK